MITDRVAYRTACHAANDEINASRSAYYQQQFTEAAASQTATWRLAKELLHSDDPPPAGSSQDASKLCNDFCSFFADKIGNITVTVNSRLFTIPAYHRRPTDRQIPCPLDELSDVTVDEVTKLIRSMPAKSSPVDFMPTAMLKRSEEHTSELQSR